MISRTPLFFLALALILAAMTRIAFAQPGFPPEPPPMSDREPTLRGNQFNRTPSTPPIVNTDNVDTLPDLVITEFTITGAPFTEALTYQHWVPVRIVVRNAAQTRLPGTTAGEFDLSVIAWNSEMVPFRTGLALGPVNSKSYTYQKVPGLAPGEEFVFNGVIGIQWHCAEQSYNHAMHFVAVADGLPNESPVEGSPCGGYMTFFDLDNLHRGTVRESDETNNVSGEAGAVLENWYPGVNN